MKEGGGGGGAVDIRYKVGRTRKTSGVRFMALISHMWRPYPRWITIKPCKSPHPELAQRNPTNHHHNCVDDSSYLSYAVSNRNRPENRNRVTYRC